MSAMVDGDDDWETWGRTDPYFGVVSHERFRRATFEEHRAEFFRSGEREVAASLEQLERLFGPVRRGRALDFGCGVGRLAIPLARGFDQAVGLDISPSMLAEAARNAAAAGVSNLTLARSDDQLSGAPGEFDLVYSYIVLQHIPVARGMALFERLLGKVRPGGSFSLHMTIGRGGAREALRRWVRYTRLGNAAANLLRGRPIATPVMQMNCYSAFEVLALLERRGIRDVVARPEWHGEHLMLSWLGRTPGAA